MSMRPLMFLPSCVLCLVLLYLPNQGNSEPESAGLPPATDLPMGLQGQMIEVTDTGLTPQTLSMSREDRVAFFMNNSLDSLITLDINFGTNSTHCASKNLEIREDGRVSSTLPVAPKDFATTCFHDAGHYPFTIKGIEGYPEGLQGAIVVD